MKQFSKMNVSGNCAGSVLRFMSHDKIMAAGLLAFVCSLLFCPPLFPQSWKFVKEKDGIRVYTRQELNSSYKAFRGVADIHSTMDKVFAIVGNVKSTDQWDPSVRDLRVLSQGKDSSFSYYLVYHVSWPLHDRDLCVAVKITHDKSTGEVVIDAESSPKLVPESSDLVRIRNYWQKWILQPLDRDHIRLILEGFADPAGNIPSWLANMVITETPLNMIHEIRQRVE